MQDITNHYKYLNPNRILIAILPKSRNMPALQSNDSNTFFDHDGEWYRRVESGDCGKDQLLRTAKFGLSHNIAGILTILGAGYIIQDIAKDAARRKPTKNRIILVMSSCDFLQAIVIPQSAQRWYPKVLVFREQWGINWRATFRALLHWWQELDQHCIMSPWPSAICSSCAMSTRIRNCISLSPTFYTCPWSYAWWLPSVACPLGSTTLMATTLVSWVHHHCIAIHLSPLLSASVVKSTLSGFIQAVPWWL